MLTFLFMCSFRESIYRLLPQTTPENIAKNFDQYTIDPATRYPNLNCSGLRPHQVRARTFNPEFRFSLQTPLEYVDSNGFNFQVRHLYVREGLNSCSLERAATIRRPVNLSRRGELGRKCQIAVRCMSDLSNLWLRGCQLLTLCILSQQWSD